MMTTNGTFMIRQDDLSSEETRSLVEFHVQSMKAEKPVGTSFALDLAGLRSPDVVLWTAWLGERVVAMGALKDLAPAHAELKSMRTHPSYTRQGAGTAILDRIILEARLRGKKRLSLETGSGPAFEPALRLYKKIGFVKGEVFASYKDCDFNQFYHLDL